MAIDTTQIIADLHEAAQERDRASRFMAGLRRLLAEHDGDSVVNEHAEAFKATTARPFPRHFVKFGVPVHPAKILQGRYLGGLRGLKGRERARIKTIAKIQGVKAAVKAMAKGRR